MTSKSKGLHRDWKPDLPVHELAGACVINTFMIAMALLDLSADLALGDSDTAFLVKFHRFKGSDPIISRLMLIFLLGLPMVLFQGLRGTLQSVLGWKRASSLRHAGDVVHFLTLVFCIAPTVVFVLLPRMNAFFESCDGAGGSSGLFSSGSVTEVCSESVSRLIEVHAAMVVLNLVMLAADVCKFAGNTGKGTDKGDEQGKEKKKEL